MGKKFLSQSLLWAAMFVLFSCQKAEVKNDLNDQFVSKVKQWLDGQKKDLYTIKAANIDLLKENLDFSSIKKGKSDHGEQIIIIPINSNFKEQKINDKTAIPNLVLLLNSSGDIRKGNVVLFKQKTSGMYTQVPDNVFSGIYSTAEVNVEGQFQFLSVAGHWNYQLDYENGMIKSFGLIKAKESSDARTNSICRDWYVLINWYNSDGNFVMQTSEYVGTTCSEQCGDGSYQSLCPDGSNPGGGWGNDVDYEYAQRRYIDWTVADYVTSAQLYIGSTELIKGKVLAGSPNGGYFTGISHNSDWCSGCSADNVNAVWVPGSGNSVSYSDNQASSSMSGTVWYQGVAYPVSNNKNWLFYEVF